MHDGSQADLLEADLLEADLLEVVKLYVKGGHPNPHLSVKVKKFDATEQEMHDLVAFMEALTGDLSKIETGRLPK